MSGILIYTIVNLDTLILENDNQSVEIYDGNGKMLDTNSYFNTKLEYEDLSANIINALIAVEDDTFMSHNGINLKRIISAAINNIKDGGFKEGASTIDQQLIKNTMLSSDKTIERKINEILLAMRLDRIYSKEQIITAYLNTILFGDNIYGIHDASLYYFNKRPYDLSINEAATLAGIIQLPNYYNPYRNIDAANKRKNLVLELMHKKGFINDIEYQESINIDLKNCLSKNDKFSKKSYLNSYLDYIASLKLSDNKIHTYLDHKIQRELFDIATNRYNHFSNDRIKTAMVVLDNKTGGILGLVGNRFSEKRVINYALEKRQCASTMKPIVDYGPAFEYLSLSPASLILDNEYSYSDGTHLKNWDSDYKGIISLRQALAQSRNIPALKLYQMVDKEKRIKFMNQLGLNPEKEFYEAESLGAGLNTYSILELANAYSTFANEGKFIKASPIKNNNSSTPSVQAIKKTTAFFINTILHDVFKGSRFDLENGYMCAKTGQNNFDEQTLEKFSIPYGSTRDSFVISYTKDITLAVWVGYDVVNSTSYLDRYETQIPRAIMKQIMEKFSTDQSAYIMPSGVKMYQVLKYDDRLYLANNGQYDYFLIGTEPKEYYKKKNYYKI